MRCGKTKIGLIMIMMIILILILPSIIAHVPKTSEGNTSLEDAKHVHDPTKSWVIYSEMKRDEKTHYYEVELKEGDRLKCSILIPEDGDFIPDLVLMGPQFEDSSYIPEEVEIPDGYGSIFIKGEKGEREYEPFTPASYYYPAEYDEQVNESSTYFVVVFDKNDHGKYGLAIGYEERYGLLEWIKVPIDVVQIHLWEGQPIWFIFSPILITFLMGSIFILWSKQNDRPIPESLGGWFTSAAGLVYIGTGGMMLLQMISASLKADPGSMIILTIIFTMLPIFLGLYTFSLGIKINKPVDLKDRVKFVIIGLLALVVWAGLIIGPIMALIGSISPFKKWRGK